MISVRQTEKKYCSRAMLVAIVAALLFIVVGQKAVAKGLVLGTLFSVVNFVLMGETLHLRLDKSKAKTFFISFGSIWCRYLVMAVPLVVAIRMEQFNFIATTVGLFFVQLAILADHLTATVSEMRGKEA
jgi:hypothetical protein